VITRARREKLARSRQIIAAKLNTDYFSASSGLLSRFKDRHGQNFKKLAGESTEVSVKSTDAWLQSLPSLLEGYEPRDAYNADKTGLFFNVLPDRTLAYKGETCHGGKHSKDRLTVLLCVNSDGSEKQVLIVIGKSSKPKSFKDVKKLPIKYHANGKAWMTTEIFCSFFNSLEKVKAFFYAHSVTDADRENILSLEKSYFQLRQNSAKKKKTMYDFFC
jgi:hypothetical protein